MQDELINNFLKEMIMFQKMGFLKLFNSESLNLSEVIILDAIYKSILKQGKVTLSTIRDTVQLAPSTISPIIKSLEEKELIERTIDKNDRRNRWVSITKKGEEYIEKIKSNNKKIISKYANYMGEEDITKFAEPMSRTTKFINQKKLLREEV